jgi:hypothetical protein
MQRTERSFPWSWVIVLAVSVALAPGCGPGTINDSRVVAREAEIADTPENRAIVQLVDSYRRALEDKDLGTLRNLISHSYYENGGTSHTTVDDYGYDGLMEVFALYAQNVRTLRLQVRIRRIEIEGERANVYVDFGYNMLYIIDGQERWQVDSDLNRMELVREDGQWRVVAGL